MNYHAIALGELLIDFTPYGSTLEGNELLAANPGGAPCNLLAMLAKAGCSTAFIGKVGDDHFGRLLKNTIENAGIDSKHLILDKNADTTLAFVHLDSEGDRSFSFYRSPGADTLLTEDELPKEMDTRLFHFGSLSMTGQPSRQATITACKAAKEAGAIISFDPNLRPILWSSMETAKEQMEWGMGQCDILKISEEELEFLTGTTNTEEGSRQLWERYQIPLIFVTLGKKGSFFRHGKTTGAKPTYTQIPAVDTTGAGDSFFGAALYKVLNAGGLEKLTAEHLEQTLEFANAAATIVASRKGAINAMPSLEEIERLIKPV